MLLISSFIHHALTLQARQRAGFLFGTLGRIGCDCDQRNPFLPTLRGGLAAWESVSAIPETPSSPRHSPAGHWLSETSPDHATKPSRLFQQPGGHGLRRRLCLHRVSVGHISVQIARKGARSGREQPCWGAAGAPQPTSPGERKTGVRERFGPLPGFRAVLLGASVTRRRLRCRLPRCPR
jgi:hypothetical protein